MEINNLLEGANPYKSLQEDASRLADKWSQSGLLEGLEGKEKSYMATVLENQAKQIVAEQSSTGTGAIGSGTGQEAWAGVALPLVRKVFSQIAAKDFVSVQPMNLPSGLVFYLDFKYGTATNGRNVGDSLYGNVSNAGDANKIGTDVEVAGGLYGTGRFGYSINETSSIAAATVTAATSASIGYDAALLPSNFENVSVPFASLPEYDRQAVRAFEINGQTVYPAYTVVSGSNVVFVADAGAVTAGNVTVNFVKQPADTSRGDFEDNPASSITIPEINVELASEAIVAKTRKLKAQWTPEFAQDLNAYHSVDAEAELTSILSEYISMEIDLELLDMLIQDAATTEKWSAQNNKVWNGTTWDDANVSDFYNTQGQWFQTLGTKVQKVSNKIHQKTLRGGANFLVVSPTVATILESIPGYAADTDGDKLDFAMGVQKVGSLNSRFRVYKNPYITENTILLGYRGSQFLETGAVYAPYIPLMMTPLVYDPNTFTPRKGLMTRYAKKMIRPEFYGKIYVSDLATV